MPDSWNHLDDEDAGNEPPTPEVDFEPISHEEPVEGTPEGIDPLGYDRGVFYYFSRATRQVWALSASGHTKQMLIGMASVPHYWERNTAWCKPKNAGIDWDKVTDFLMRSCRDRGIYDPDLIRGRGAWLDNGRPILHMGDHLIVGDDRSPLRLAGSRHIYEAARPFSQIGQVAPLSTREAHKLVEICKSLRWERGISGLLLAGFIVIAPICGGLNWRPSIWITGAKGSGKSWAEEHILSPAIGRIALRVLSNTTEPAIRRTLGSDARPVLFDEAEQEDAASVARMQAVLGLVRQSASEGGGEILKASSGDGVARFRVRSCFGFSSINVGIMHGADESRITVLGFRPPEMLTAEDRIASDQQFAKLSKTVAETITPEFSAALLARSVRLLPIIRKNAETFARAVSIHLGTRRLGDQLGTLLAGAYALHKDRPVTDDEAVAFLKRESWEAEVEQAEERDEHKLLTHLTQHRIGISPQNGGRLEVTIGRLILAASGRDKDLHQETADRELRQVGIRYEPRTSRRDEGVFVSATHPTIRRVLANTPWSSSWHRALERLPQAVRNKTVVRFAFGHQSRATWIPWTTIEPDEVCPKPEVRAA